MSIGFEHEFSAHWTNKVERGNSYEEDAPAEQLLLTVLRDPNGTEVQRWLPGENIYLPLKDILNASGIDLTSINKRAKENHLQNASIPYGALLRITGTELQIEMNYQ